MIYDILFTDGDQTRTWHAHENDMTDTLIGLQCDGHYVLKISKNHYCEVFDYTNMSKFMHLPAIDHPAQAASGWWEIHQETSDQLYTRPSGTYRIS